MERKTNQKTDDKMNKMKSAKQQVPVQNIFYASHVTN